MHIGAFPYPNTSSLGSIYIRKIQIEEIPPANSFAITPAISNLTCGSTTPITFTINNTNNLPNITNYNWNLGQVPNGWLLPNGSTAPANYSTGTINSLTLTPDCGKSLSNISCMVSSNGTNFNTNVSTITITQPTYSILGINTLCSGSTVYTLDGLVCNSSLVWTSPPSNLAALSSFTSSPTTLSNLGSNGNFVLTANVTSCGVTTPVTLPLRIGPYSSSDYIMTGGGSSIEPLYWCPNKAYDFSINGSGSNYLWSIPTGWTLNYQSNYLCVLKAPLTSYPPTGTVSANFTEPCGNIISKSFYTAFSSSACNGTDPRFNYSPNPAPSYINITVASGYTSTTKIQRIQIVGTMSGVTVFDQNYGQPGVLSAFINTYSFQSGTYTLRIYDGSIWATYQFIR